MQQIADWLEKLGLGQYAPRFAENDINFAILSDLTDQDLKELGVSSLGHRRQLLRAIAELNSVEKGAPKRAPATAAPVHLIQIRIKEAEIEALERLGYLEPGLREDAASIKKAVETLVSDTPLM
jgi:hypothetical protein